MSNPRHLLFADTETTNLNPAKGARMIELALVSLDLETGKVMTMSKRYKPDENINKRAQAVHGISMEDLKDEAEFGPEDAEQLNNIIGHCDLLVAHNAAFDVDFIYSELCRFIPDDRLSDIEVFCTMQNGRWAAFEGAVPSLKVLATTCGLIYDETLSHSALYDTELLKDAFMIAYKNSWWHEHAKADSPPPFPEYKELTK